MNPVIIPTLSLVIILNFIIGIVILSRGFRNKVNLLFGLISLGTSLWAIGILGFYLIKIPLDYLWIMETHFSAAAIAVIFLLFTFNFPTLLIKRTYIRVSPLLPFFIILFYLFFTKSIIGDVDGITYEISSGYIFYALFVMLCFFIGYYALFLQYKKSSTNEQKIQVKYVLGGAVLSSSLATISDLILPYFGIFEYTWLGPIFTFFLVGAIAYAILKHHLFNIKVVATELFTFAIWIALLVRIFFSNGVQDLFVNISLLLVVVFFGIMVIRGVILEIERKEQMEKMAEDLEVAYGVEKQAKERVEKAKAEDEALLGSIGDGVVAVDKQGKIMFVNRAAEDMLGFKSEQAIDKPYKQVLEMQNEKNEALENGKDPIYEALNSGKKIITDATNTPEKTVYFVKQDKTRFPVAVTVAPVILQGKTIGAVNVFRDVTVERQIDKSKSEFVSLASHQLRTPLTAIKWYAEMLMNKRSGTLSPKQKQYLNVIYDGDMRMIKLIDIMLSVSRLDAGKVKINNEYADIRKVAEIIIGEEQVNIKKRKQKFAFECDEKEAKTVTDPNQLRIVFQNIISNAVKYTPEGGRIVCNIKRDGDNFLFSVKDSGIGIPKDQQKRIFEKLFRADNAFSHEPDGNGLGLYAAKATIENLGGKIWFESEEGKGTTFFVTVPIKR